MKKSIEIIQVDWKKIPLEILEKQPKEFEKILEKFANEPILLKDNRRSGYKYYVAEYGYTRCNEDDFEQNRLNLFRRIRYKQYKDNIPILQKFYEFKPRIYIEKTETKLIDTTNKNINLGVWNYIDGFFTYYKIEYVNKTQKGYIYHFQDLTYLQKIELIKSELNITN